MSEANYAFRRRLDQIHKPDRVNADLNPGSAETVIETGWHIIIPPDASPYLIALAEDLQNYFFVSMRVSLTLRRARLAGIMAKSEPNAIVLGSRNDFERLGADLTVPRSYRLVVKRDILVVCGYDERGIGQGCYYIEDLMNLREAPFLTIGDATREPIFQPRMVHSGWGIDQFPDQHLNAIAHAGMDAILVFVKGINRTTMGFLDMNDLIRRAAGYGLDVYLYSYLHSSKHPDDPDAADYYERTYGDLIRALPGAKGVIFVGESCEFPSKDERTKMRTRHDPAPADAASDSRPFPGWWPCHDYPKWLALIKKVIRRANPECDIVFWTYNWGWAPEENRVELIRSLPRDISLQATFEMFENIRKDDVPTRCVDYTVSFEGPGQYFASEAQAASEQGIPLYTMSNTAGLTWDIGVIPFEPVPFQWNRRYEGLIEAQRKWGLKGLMESHHYGWWPSVVSELAKWAFWKPREDVEEMATKIAHRDYGEDAGPLVVQAWRLWSDAIRDYVPTNEDQYGPFRVGPSYPLVFLDHDVTFPCADYAHFGSRILKTLYRSHDPSILDGEMALLKRMSTTWEKGLAHLHEAADFVPSDKRPALADMTRLGEFILRCLTTTLHVKMWFGQNEILRSEDASPEDKNRALDTMLDIAGKEIQNAERTIRLTDADSRLGWEPSMEYMTDPPHLRWKIGQVTNVVETLIPQYRSSLQQNM